MNRMSKKIMHQMSTLLIATTLGNAVLASTHGFWDRRTLIERRAQARDVRIAATVAECKNTIIKEQRTNGDLERYRDHRGSYSKALAHDPNGIVTQASFHSMIHALKNGNPNLFDEIIMGGARTLVNPQASYAFSLEGADVTRYTIAPAPAFASAEASAEMVELYWGALLRDVPFNEYDTNPIAAQAIADLNNQPGYRGPKINGQVTAQALWRGIWPGDLVGPYISQFLYQPVPDHGKPVPQNYYTYQAGLNYLTDVDGLLLVQNGGSTGQTNQYLPNPTFIHDARDLGAYVHFDYPTEEYMNAASILLGYGTAALDANNPYKTDLTQSGYITYGQPDVLALINVAAITAFKACWYQKWINHLRLRPEYFGLLIQQQIVDNIHYGINSDLINSAVLPQVFDLYGTYLLPQMYPEGSPTHPSYPCGHGVIGGACVTILKAFFNENFAIPNPVQPNSSNTALVPYVGTLYVGDELNKLASNIGKGRDFAGIHYRSDCLDGNLLGEQIAISILEDEAYTRNENFNGWILTKFDGETIVVGAKKTLPPSQNFSCNPCCN